LPPRPAATAPTSVSRNHRSLPRYPPVHPTLVPSRPPSLLVPLSSLPQSPRSLSDPRPRHPLPQIPRSPWKVTSSALDPASATSSALDRRIRFCPRLPSPWSHAPACPRASDPSPGAPCPRPPHSSSRPSRDPPSPLPPSPRPCSIDGRCRPCHPCPTPRNPLPSAIYPRDARHQVLLCLLDLGLRDARLTYCGRRRHARSRSSTPSQHLPKILGSAPFLHSLCRIFYLMSYEATISSYGGNAAVMTKSFVIAVQSVA
jgi:hypothetical protein